MLNKKKIYQNGKLKGEAREKLQKKLDKENNKDSMLSKFDRKYGKKEKKKEVGEAGAVKEKTAEDESLNKKLEKVSIKSSAAETPNKVEKTEEHEEEDIDTPPRNEIVKQRRAQANSKDVNWISIIEHSQKGAKRDEKNALKLEEASRNMIRSDLDKQIKQRQEVRDAEKKAKLEYNQQQRELFQKWEKEDLEKSKTALVKSDELKKIRRDQIEELDKRRQKEERKIKIQGKREVARLRKELADDKVKELEKKKKNLSKMQEMLVENKKHKIKLKEEERKDAEEAIMLQKQYAEILKKQEEARENKLKEMFKSQEQKVSALVDATAESKKAEAEAEARAARQRTEYEKKLDDMDKAKKAKLAADQQSCNDCIAQQILEKKARLKKEVEEDRAYGRKLKAQAEAAQKIDDDKEKVRKKKLLEQQSFLKEQVELLEKRRMEQRAEISETEKLMNKKLLDKIEQGELEENEIKVDPKAPFAWRYTHRKAPF